MVFNNREKIEIAVNTLGIDSANKSDEELDKIRFATINKYRLRVQVRFSRYTSFHTLQSVFVNIISLTYNSLNT